MIFMAFYKNMVVPTKSEDIAFEEFLKELPEHFCQHKLTVNKKPAKP